MRNNIQKRVSRFKWTGLFLSMIFLTVSSMAQIKISGKVANEKGDGISAATVTIKNSNSGTTGNDEGAYLLSTVLKAGKYTLVFSAIGYRSIEESVNITDAIDYRVNVQLKTDALGMDEVVLIGSSLTSKRKQLGNTINSVGGKQLQNAGSGNIGAALQGKVPGAQITQTSGDPAGSISVRMRGTSTIQGSSEPLYVIDGVIVSNATTNVTNPNVDAGARSEIGTNRMADINPNDIEKIDVIPGASASAIYGSRASNGVVLITTKRGKAGQMKIDFSTGIILNSLRQRVYISKYGKQFGSAALRLGNISNGPGATLSYTRPDGALRTLSTDIVDVTRYDYQDNIFQKGLGTDNFLSIGGGTEKTKYYFSGGYFKNEGIIKNTDFRRYNLKTRVEHNFNKYITLLAGIAYTNSFANEKPNGNVFWSPINSVNITNNIFNINQKDAAGNNVAVEATRVNPLSVIEDMKLTQAVNRTISDLQLKIKPVAGLNIDYILGLDNFSQEGRNYIKRPAYAAGFEGTGYVANVLINTALINNDINISYQTNFKKISSLTSAGFSHQYQKITGVAADGRDLLNGITTINAATASTINTRYTDDVRQVFGGYVQQTFGFDNIIFVTAAGRIDGSTTFPKDTRTYFYPKVSGSFNFSDAKFWAASSVSKWVNSGRIRASWGQAGNLTGISSYGRFDSYLASNINGIATYNADPSLGNALVEPERASELEVGTDLSFFNNKLGLVFTVYSKKIIENSLLVQRNLAPSSGGTSRFENVGNLTNKGWELGLTVNPVDKNNFKWNIYGSVNRNKNLVTASSQVTPIFLNNALGANSFTVIAGQPVGAFFGNYFRRDASNNIALDAAGRPIAETTTGITLATKVIGSPNPDWILSLNNSFDYKKLNFSFLFDGALGQDVFNADRRTRQGVGFGDYAEREVKGEIPRGYIFSIYNTEEWRLESGSYIKLREVSLSYTLPAFSKLIKSAAVSLVGRNLISFDSYDGYDPETNAGGNSSALRGIDFGNVPIPRTFQLTFRASF
ncbi:MAG: SusC/RagA family TonB-linked outer membrane protein [Ferruginibacter sp.]|nr:SusC/RagA family TonB-linked outer membrane protein [Ferruginibacter sp.]